MEKKKNFERTVSETVQEKLGFQCGRVFCETYFNEDAKQDVASIIRQIIDVYDNRLAHMEWMTESTRQEARKKLKAITVKVGYPDEWPQDKLSLVLKSPDQGGVYIDNIMEILKASQDYSFTVSYTHLLSQFKYRSYQNLQRRGSKAGPRPGRAPEQKHCSCNPYPA